ncbi:MAG TPA: OsmC family protein [Candidatus Dormibacteraeota bacterium]|nr:OsmC family protein [Candidatus Dormibacteraeota bacterium]
MPTTNTMLATFVDPATGVAVDAVTGSGFALSFDTADAGESRRGPSPTEVVLATLAACTAMDVAAILRKKRQRAADYQIAVSGERADKDPQVYTSIVVEHRVVGAVEPEALRRSVELSATRYCPVNAMLSASVTIEHRYRLWRGKQVGDGESAVVTVTGPEGVRRG